MINNVIGWCPILTIIDSRRRSEVVKFFPESLLVSSKYIKIGYSHVLCGGLNSAFKVDKGARAYLSDITSIYIDQFQ